MPVRIVERRAFESSGQEARIVMSAEDRVEICPDDNSWTITIQDDGHGKAEISVIEGKATLYT